MITKIEIDKLAEKYEKPEFISSDPIQFPHKFKDKADIEISGFISSLIAYGSRKVFIKKLLLDFPHKLWKSQFLAMHAELSLWKTS
jgi:hypothetical protein